ncbi:MAG: tetratricopeptide repeat protein [Phycisphaerales bacterium]
MRSNGIAAFGTQVSLTVVAIIISLTLTETAHGQGDEFSLRPYYTANGFLNRGLYEEAVSEYFTYLESEPQGVEAATARYGLAVALSQLNRSDDALNQLELIEAPPQFAFQFESELLRAQLLYGKSAFHDAGELARELVQSKSDHPQSHVAAGLWIECLYRLGDHTAAVQHTREVLQNASFTSRDIDRAALFGALSLSMLGDDQSAVQLLRPISGRRDELGNTASLSLASVLLRLNQSDEAATLYEKLAALDSSIWSPQALLGLARIQRDQGAHDNAIALLQQLEEEFSGSSVSRAAQLELGINLIESGQSSAGRESLPDFAENDPSPLASRSAYWRAKSMLREGSSAEAVLAFEDALAMYPHSSIGPEMQFDLGVARRESGDPEGAAAVFQDLHRAHPEHRIANSARLAEATTLLSLGKLEEARRAASRIDPSVEEATEAELVVAEADAQSGDHEKVVKRLSRWLASDSGHDGADRARYRLSMSLAALTRLDDAERVWATLLHGDDVPQPFQPGLVVLGDAAYRSQDWVRAERWFDRAMDLEVSPQTAVSLKLGLTYARQGRHSDAIPLFQRAAEDSSGGDASTQALFEFAQSNLMLGRDDEASAAFSTLLISAPDSRFRVHAMRQLGGIAERSGSPDTAASWYEQAAALGGDTAQDSRRDQARAALAAGDYEVPVTLAATWDDPDLVVFAGIAQAKSGDLREAISVLESVLNESELSDEVRSAALLEKAWCERQLGDSEKSMASLQRLLGKDRRDRYAVYAALEAASIELKADQVDTASLWLNRASDIMRSHPEVAELAMKAQLDLRTAQHATATNDHERVIASLNTFDERYPQSDLGVHAAVLLGDAFIGSQQPERAAEAFERAVQSADGEIRVTAVLRLGEALGQAKRWQQSREVYQGFLGTYPDSEYTFEAEFGRAWALEHDGEYEQAREGYARVIKSHSGETAARAQFQIGECLFAEGRHDDAVRELLRVDILYDYPEWSAAALYDAGRAFEQLRKFGEARQQYREIGERFGDSTWADLAADRLVALSSAD